MKAQALLLHRDNPLAWAVMPAACDRIASFCERVGTDAPAEMMVGALRLQFVLPQPEVICIVALGERGIAGHLLANLEKWGGKTNAHVLQLEIDDSSIPRSERARAFELLLGWARESGAEQLQGYVPEQHFDRLGFWKRLGFAQKYIVMRRPLDLSAGSEEVANARPGATHNEEARMSTRGNV